MNSKQFSAFDIGLWLLVVLRLIIKITGAWGHGWHKIGAGRGWENVEKFMWSAHLVL